MPRNRLLGVMKYYSPTGRRNHGRPLKRLLDSETGTGQQVAQLHEIYMMMMMIIITIMNSLLLVSLF